MLRLGCVWYCAVLLWVSGMGHAANRYFFLGTVLNYQLVPPTIAAMIAVILPWFHLMLCAVLIAPGNRSKTPCLATAMLGLVFVLVQITALVRGLPIDCGCFGVVTERPIGAASLLLAGSLIVAGLSAAWSVLPRCGGRVGHPVASDGR